MRRRNWRATWFGDSYVFPSWREAAEFLSLQSVHIKYFGAPANQQKLDLLRSKLEKCLRLDEPFRFIFDDVLKQEFCLKQTRGKAFVRFEHGKLSWIEEKAS